jgi:uncharacterized membrane protein
MKYKQYFWYIPALYVAFMFCEKIIEGMSHDEEFIQIISVIPQLQPYAYTLTPLVGIVDCLIGLALLFNPVLTKSKQLQTALFAWVTIWPFIPATLRMYGGVGEFEIVEVLSISMAAVVAYALWREFAQEA